MTGTSAELSKLDRRATPVGVTALCGRSRVGTLWQIGPHGSSLDHVDRSGPQAGGASTGTEVRAAGARPRRAGKFTPISECPRDRGDTELPGNKPSLFVVEHDQWLISLHGDDLGEAPSSRWRGEPERLPAARRRQRPPRPAVGGLRRLPVLPGAPRPGWSLRRSLRAPRCEWGTSRLRPAGRRAQRVPDLCVRAQLQAGAVGQPASQRGA